MAIAFQTLTPAQMTAVLNGPAATPPPGVKPDFNTQSSFLPAFSAVVALCVGITSLAILARIYTKLFLMRSVAYEDSWIGQISETIAAMFTVRYGAGVHQWNIQYKTLVSQLYWLNVNTLTYSPTILFIKLSILLQYFRVFNPTREGNKFLYWGIYWSIGTCIVFYITSTIFSGIGCIPRERIWNPLITEGFCFDSSKGFRATGLFNIVSDFIILLLPIPTVWGLKLPSSKKFGIMAVFSAGFFACLASIVRAVFVWDVIGEADFSYDITPAGFWAQAEICIGLVVACLPVAPRFFQALSPKLRRLLPCLPQTTTVDDSQYPHTLSRSDIRLSTKKKRPSSEQHVTEKWEDPYDVRAQLTSPRGTLTKQASQSARKGNLGSRSSSVRPNQAAGHMGIRVEQRIEVETTPKDTPMTSLELARTRKDRTWLMV